MTSPAPLVNGVGPISGCPGTMIKIRGQNLGLNENDIKNVFIGGIDVRSTVKYKNSSQITAITPNVVGELEIIIFTYSSNDFGTCTVQYNQVKSKNVNSVETVSFWPEDERKVAIVRDICRNLDNPDANSQYSGLPESEHKYLDYKSDDHMYPQAQEYSSSGSVELIDQDFDPLLFLKKYYKYATFEDVKKSLYNFRQNSLNDQKTTDDSVKHFKNNLQAIFECLTTIETLKQEIEREKKQVSNQQPVEKLIHHVERCMEHGDNLFKDVISRKEYSDAALNCLVIMKRYHFLFYLPQSIRTNIEEGKYQSVISDYRRAKSLFGTKDVTSMITVFKEVEELILNFTAKLRSQLIKMPIEFNEAKDLVRYLCDLDVDYDPAWLCLTKYKEWLLNQFNDYRNSYRINLHLNNEENEYFNYHQKYFNNQTEFQPTMYTQVLNVNNVLQTYMILFWRLGTTYMQNQLPIPSKNAKFSFGQVNKAPEENTGLPDTPYDIQSAWIRINKEVCTDIAETLRLVLLNEKQFNKDSRESDSLSRSSTLKEDKLPQLSQSISQFKTKNYFRWVTKSITSFRQCIGKLPYHELPKESIEIFSQLCLDLRISAIKMMISNARTKIQNLSNKEAWNIEINDVDGAITSSSRIYEDIMCRMLRNCRDFIESSNQLETQVFTIESFQDEFPELCQIAMCAYLSSLSNIMEQIDSTTTDIEKLTDKNLPESMKTRKFMSLFSKSFENAFEKRLQTKSRAILLLLNNTDWSHKMCNNNILNLYKSLNYVGQEIMWPTLNGEWNDQAAIFSRQYIQTRSEWIYSQLDENLGNYYTCNVKTFPVDEEGHQGRISKIQHIEMYMLNLIICLSEIASECLLFLGQFSFNPNIGKFNDKDYGAAGNRSGNLVLGIIMNSFNHLIKCFDSYQAKSWPRRNRLQISFDVSFIENVLPDFLLPKESVDELKSYTLFSQARDGSDAMEITQEEIEMINELVIVEKKNVNLLAQGLGNLEKVSQQSNLNPINNTISTTTLNGVRKRR